MGECITDPGFKVVVIAREDGSNEDAWGVEVSSSAIGWSGSQMSSGWGELGLTRPMVEVSVPLISKRISNSPVLSSLFTTLRYSRERMMKGPLWCYAPILFLGVNKVGKNVLISFYLSDSLWWKNYSLWGRRARQATGVVKERNKVKLCLHQFQVPNLLKTLNLQWWWVLVRLWQPVVYLQGGKKDNRGESWWGCRQHRSLGDCRITI